MIHQPLADNCLGKITIWLFTQQQVTVFTLSTKISQFVFITA